MRVAIVGTVGDDVKNICQKAFHTAIKLGEPVEAEVNGMGVVFYDIKKYRYIMYEKEPLKEKEK